MLGLDMTSRLIGSGPIRPPVRPSKGQSGVLQAIDHSVVGSMTAQPAGIRNSALRVAIHDQQVASLGECLTSLQMCSRRLLQPLLTGQGMRNAHRVKTEEVKPSTLRILLMVFLDTLKLICRFPRKPLVE